MNVEIGAEAALFPEKEYMLGDFRCSVRSGDIQQLLENFLVFCSLCPTCNCGAGHADRPAWVACTQVAGCNRQCHIHCYFEYIGVKKAGKGPSCSTFTFLHFSPLNVAFESKKLFSFWWNAFTERCFNEVANIFSHWPNFVGRTSRKI